LASFFVKHGKPGDTIAQFRAAGSVSSEQRRTLLADLLASKDFAEAFEVWSSAPQANGEPQPAGIATLINGGFEDPISRNEIGFAWLTNNLRAVRASLDPTDPRSGSYSLRVDWSGDSDPSSPVISQLVLVAPQTRYRLTFAARTQELTTIGLPIVTVVDAGDENKTVSMYSKTLPKGTSGWQDYTGEFTTAATTRAVVISIRRENCPTPVCPAFGHGWFDDFSLETPLRQLR